MSVFGVNLAEGRVTARLKTGYLVGAERDDLTTVGGASPGAAVAGRRFVYVANATNDAISVIDTASQRLVRQIDLNVPGLERLRGVLPFGEALSADEKRLYVACAGLNAVAVIDLERNAVDGYIPAGWFASLVALVDDDKTLVVGSAKGLGSGPNGGAGFVEPARGAHPGDIMQGTLQLLPVPDRQTLAAYTRQVIANTYASSRRTARSIRCSAAAAACAATRRSRRWPTRRRTIRRSPIGSPSATTSTATRISPTRVTAGSSAYIRTSGSK
jgi:YVTN family beta-propeller protein